MVQTRRAHAVPRAPLAMLVVVWLGRREMRRQRRCAVGHEVRVRVIVALAHAGARELLELRGQRDERRLDKCGGTQNSQGRFSNKRGFRTKE
eukprot:1544427-Pleurochrysis_carterae.AAC.1